MKIINLIPCWKVSLNITIYYISWLFLSTKERKMLVPFLLNSLRLHVRDIVILGRIGLNLNILPPLLMHFVTIPHTYQKPILTCSEGCPLVQVVACVTHDMEDAHQVGWQKNLFGGFYLLRLSLVSRTGHIFQALFSCPIIIFNSLKM